MKKALSVILSVLLLSSLVILPVSAQAAYPESEHDYKNNEYLEWVWTEPGAYGLYITFDKRTFIEEGSFFGGIEIIPDVKSAGLTVGDVVGNILPIRFGDTLYIYDGDSNLVGAYDGDELAGKSVFVQGDTVKIVLESDSAETAWGFKVTDITPVYESDIRKITYHSCDDSIDDYTQSYFKNETPVIAYGFYNGYDYVCPEKSVLVGWSLTPGGEIAYNGGEWIDAAGQNIDLYAVWAHTLLSEDEVFYFTNSRWYLDITENGGYYLTKEDYNMIISNLYRVYGVGPMPSVAMSIVLSKMPDFEFNGSCYGMTTCVALQHLGMIDMLSMQGVDCVRELDADDDLVSFINYYQAQAATSWATENKALTPATATYKTNLKRLYSTVKEGNIAMLTYYEDEMFITAGHTVLITGCYDDAEGNHVLIAYNCNYPGQYRDGRYSSRYTISPDWSEIEYEGETIGAINWTDDFSQFESFSITGDGNVLLWHASFFNHLADLIKSMTLWLRTLFGVE